jgi:dynein heavy chain
MSSKAGPGTDQVSDAPVERTPTEDPPPELEKKKEESGDKGGTPQEKKKGRKKSTAKSITSLSAKKTQSAAGSADKLLKTPSKKELAGSGAEAKKSTISSVKKGRGKGGETASSKKGPSTATRSATAKKMGKAEEGEKDATMDDQGEESTLGQVPHSALDNAEAVLHEAAQPVVNMERLIDERTKDLVNYFRKVLALKDWDRSQPFTEAHLNILKEFFTGEGRKRIFAYVQPHDSMLCLQTSVPTHKFEQVIYFITKSSVRDDDPLTTESFCKKVQYGTLSGVPLQSLLRLMNGVYMPMMMQNSSWPDNVRKEFMGKLHKFMASLTDATYQMSGNTVLYVPREDISNMEVAVKSKDLVQRLEILVVHWQRQIKDVINSQHTSSTAENSGPLEEVQFWQRRCDDLSSISKQLNRPEVLRILEFLKFAKSSYMDQFMHLSNQIHDGSLQAQDNLKFLSALVAPCNKLSVAEPKQIPPILPHLLSCIRLIWSRSKFYNTKERLTSLLRKVSNDIIQRCRAKISLEDIFHGDVEVSMVSLQDSIQCGEAWKSIYKKTANHIAKYTKQTWDFDQSSIFAQIDAFVQRCRDLLEVCEGQIQFARKVHGGEKSPIPVFGGSRGPEIEKSVQDIEVAFEKQMEVLWDIRTYILDVKATRWHDDYNSFKQGVKDLEIMMQNVIASAFDSTTTLSSSVELLEIFHNLAKREAIRRTVEKKTADVYQLFLQQINNVKIEFEVHRKTPAIVRFHPDYAGGAYWAKSLLKRIKGSNTILTNAPFLPYTTLADEAKTQYEPLVAALEDYVAKTHAEWVASIEDTIATRLEIPLMERHDDVLDIKFDKDLLRLFGEIHYWQKLKFDIPFHVQEIFSKKEELRVLRENVMLVVRDYNRIIDTLSLTERAIFRERIRFLDRKINPGLTTLTWGSKGITEYFVKECRRHSQDVQRTVTQFIDSNNSVQRICKAMSDTLLWHVEYKKVYDLDDFSREQRHHRGMISDKLRTLHNELQGILTQTHEIFKNDGKEVQNQWVLYVEKVDQLVEDALRLTVKRSLQEISKAINGEGKTQDAPSEVHPLFKINVVLQSQRVEFSPTLAKLETTVNDISREMISAIEVVPRLAESLPDAPSRKSPMFFDIISSEEDILKIFLSIQNGMTSNWNKCQDYLRNWDNYREIWEINKDAFIRRYAKLRPAMTTFDADINRYNEVANNTQKEETLTNIHFARLDCSPLKHALVAHCNEWQNKLTTLLNTNAKTDLNNLHKLFATNTAKLRTPPSNLDGLAESLDLLTQLQADIPNINSYFGPIRDQYKILEKYEVPITDQEKHQLETLDIQWVAFQQTITDAEKTFQDYKAQFKQELLSSVDEFNKNINVLSEDFNSKAPFRSNVPSDKALELIEGFQKSLNTLTNSEKVLKKGLTVFKIEQPQSKELERMYHQVDLMKQVWELSRGWDKAWSEWKLQPFKNFKSEEAEEVSQEYLKRITKIGRETKDWEVWSTLQERVKQLRRTIPIFHDLKNPAIRERHWQQLMDDVGKVFDPQRDDFTLEKVIEMGFDQYADNISTLSGAATKELSIEQGIATIEKQWAEQTLDVVPYKEDKGCYRVRSTDAVFELLEDNQVTLSAMKSSKYYASFQKEIDHWEKTLSHVVDIIELLLQVQRSWVYLENIFVGAEDIRKQLPTESAVFDGVNTQFKTIMRNMYQTRLVLPIMSKPMLGETLADMQQKLEKIQKSLDMYLETKRQAFPRFYFLSNEDLLEILGQAKEPSAVQPHLKKCFDNIHKLELIVTGTDNRRHNASSGMHSGDGEFVPFTTPIIVEGPVEAWLSEVEGAMRGTLRRLLLGCIGAQKKSKRDRWVKEWPGQLTIVASQITWTGECTKALGEQEKGEKHALRSLKKRQMSTLKKLSDLVKGHLTKVERKKLIALITIEVHARDVIDRMAKSGCNSPSAFEWLSQLRFYWDKEEEDCIVKQTNTTHKYGHEYLGNSGRLVITPLTDRCYMTLTTALHLHRGGSPQGPAGTGKTETVKDLGKGLGKYVIVLNCSEALDYKSMGRMFSGLAQTGAWGCFDEFNRIDIEVLSVVALQVSSILSAIARHARSFVFESTEIKLVPSCGIFITMNPGYAGRTELPDNLKSLFRPVAMMVPDSALIAEIMLFAEGFSNTRVLAKKVDTLYKLSIQQLSKQDHYDFGLRAMTTALRTAGSYKRNDPEALDDGQFYYAT